MLWSTFKYDGYIKIPCSWLDDWHRGHLISRDNKHGRAPCCWSLGCLGSLHFPSLPTYTEAILVRFDRLAGISEKQSSYPLHENYSWEEENIRPAVQTREVLDEPSRICSAEAGTVTNWPSWHLMVFAWWGCYRTQEKELGALWLVRKGNEKGQWLKSVRNPASFFCFFTISVFRGKLPWMI